MGFMNNTLESPNNMVQTFMERGNAGDLFYNFLINHDK